MPTIQEQLSELASLVQSSASIIPQLEAFIPEFLRTVKQGNRVLTCGNGGSAADAMHLAEELVGKYRSPRPAYSAICLNADPTVLTCIANDWDYDTVFSRQVEAHGRKGDLLIVFTTSGNSENILKALETARAKEVKTLALLGKGGGKCKGKANYEIIIPGDNTARIQEMHTWILHVLLEALEASQ